MQQNKTGTKTAILNFFRKIFLLPFLETILAFFTRKKGFIGRFSSKFVPPNYLFPSPSIRKLEIEGIKLVLDISDYVGHYLYFGFHDIGSENLFSQVKKDFVIVDVGANIGYTALRMANLSGSSGTVYAFEPDSFNFSKLQEHVKLNPHLNVIPINSGLSSEKTNLKLNIFEEKNRGMNRVSTDDNSNYSIISVNTLDNFSQEFKWEKIDVIKIDVEGYEYNVLKGSAKILKEIRPLLFIEVDDINLKQYGSSAKQLINLLHENNYQCVHAKVGEKVTENYYFGTLHFDIIAFPNKL
ncbi:MAG: FkbM family methyltransferase [Sphingobacteriaceae bacterium]|nr:FkbM family methyltransferase [Sphingobacteriaceae bacterium]